MQEGYKGCEQSDHGIKVGVDLVLNPFRPKTANAMVHGVTSLRATFSLY